MSLDVLRLVGYQRSELRKAEILRERLLLAQFLVALPAAMSVFFEDGVILFYLAIVSGVFLILWMWLDHEYREHRAAAERARRAVFIVDGLGLDLSPPENLRLLKNFRVSDAEAAANQIPGYFATDAPPSTRRVGEMLSESAFYSEKLQGESARLSLLWFAVIVAIFIAVAWTALPIADKNFEVIVARVFLALLIFLLSSDVRGAIQGHFSAWLSLKEVLLRLETTDARGYPQPDVLLLLGDYCATMEKAPTTLPFVYNWRRARLDQLWAAYQRERVGGASIGTTN